MKKYTTLFVDIDDTLLDFLKCEESAFLKTCLEKGVENGEEIYPRYSKINDDAWKELEKGIITREQVVLVRFERLFKEIGVALSPEEFNNAYRQNLSSSYYLIDGADTLLKKLQEHYKIYALTNGIKYTQDRRIAACGLAPFFDKVFISEEVGYAKPDKRFYDHVIDNIQEKDRTKMLMFGDSLTSDMKGGINAGIDTCWYNPHAKPAPNDLNLTYTVQNYDELLDILL